MPSRTALRAFQPFATPARRCERLLSSSSSASTKRPAVARPLETSPARQPVVQKRFYKSVEEAKSRYRVGVGNLSDL